MAEQVQRAETELRLDDAWLDANSTDAAVFVDVIRRDPIAAFVPACRTVPATTKGRFQNRWLKIDNSTISRDATHAYINKGLINHQEGQQIVGRYECGVLHPECVRYIYPNRTTARGISVFS